MDRNKLYASLSGLTGVLIVLGIVVVINVIAGRTAALRMDLTDEKLYTLSDNTRSMLSELKRDVTLKFYFSRSAEGTPIPIKQYAQRIQDLLGEYETHGRGRVRLEIFDPKPDSDEEEWARKFGLSPQGLGSFGGQNFYLGIATVSGTREAAIPFLAPRLEPRLEYLVTRLIYEVSRTARPVIGVMSGLPVMGRAAMPYRAPQQPTPAWSVISEIRRMHEVREVNPSAEEIPKDVETLLLIHPKDLSDGTLFAIDQFVMRGGRLLAFVDPMCLAEQETQQQPSQFGGMNNASDLNKLSQAWGLELRTGKLVGDPRAATAISRGPGGGAEESIAWLSLRDDLINREEVATASLEFLMMPFAGALTGEPAEGLTMVPLLSPSDDAGLVDSFAAMGSAQAARQQLEPESGLHLGVRLQGNFMTAFPGGPPSSGDAESEEDGARIAKPDSLQESSGRGAVLLVTDVDMLYDRFSVQSIPFLGQTLQQPMNDNLNFALNLVEQMAGSEALIGLRSRGTYERPFTKVVELQRAARERWQSEEQSLQAELREAQARMNELQGAKDQDQRFILSPAQEEEIENFNTKLFETRRQLKEVRKNLRRDIEALGLRLKFMNIAAVPLAVAAFGIFRGLRRRRRAAIG